MKIFYEVDIPLVVLERTLRIGNIGMININLSDDIYPNREVIDIDRRNILDVLNMHFDDVGNHCAHGADNKNNQPFIFHE